MSDTDSTMASHNVNQMQLEKAALYYSQYARIFPLQPGTKIPLLPGSWTSYASQDPIQIMQWWRQTPEANIAVVADTNLTILDLDTKDGKDGVASLRELYATLNLDLSTIPAPVTTPTGGKHVFFKHPHSEEGAFHNATNKGSLGGVDVRSGNAYVVAAPSRLSGVENGYRWGDSAPGDPLADLPELPSPLITTLRDWALDNVIDISADQPALLTEPSDLTKHPLNTLPQHLQVFARRGDASHYGGDGSSALMALASRLYLLGLDDDEVLTFLAFYPGPSNVAFKRRGGNFDSAVSWLWKYSCLKARKNRKMQEDEVRATFEQHGAPVNDESPIGSPSSAPGKEVSVGDIKSLEDFELARELIRQALELAPLEKGQVIGELKARLKTMGVASRVVDEEVRIQETALRSMGNTGERGGPVFRDISENGAIRNTTENFLGVMNHYGVGISHNTMSHDYDIYVPSSQWLADTQLNDQRTYLRDLMEKYGMPSGRVDEFISFVGGQNAYHPVLKMLSNVTWDGIDRLTPVLNTLNLAYGTTAMRDKLVSTWLVSAVKVIKGYGQNPPRGVLVLAGPQYCGKTSFFRLITPFDCLGEGLHLDVHDKDSMKRALKYWIVELGELDATFKKSDISALKAHISNTSDEIRLPYAAKESKWPRRTIYAGTVNRVDFLQDYSGNTRFWPVEVTGVDVPALRDIMAGEGLPQFWAQIENMLNAGHPYLLSQEENRALEQHNNDFREIKLEEELMLATFDWTKPCDIPMTLSEITAACGAKVEVKGRNAFSEPLQRLTGQSRSIHIKRNGKLDRCWKMPPLKVMVNE